MSDEFVVTPAIDLHLVLVEAMPEVARDGAVGELEAVRVISTEGAIGQMLGLGLGHRRRHALGGQAFPNRRQFAERLAVAIALGPRPGGRLRHTVRAWETAIEIVEAPVLR